MGETMIMEGDVEGAISVMRDVVDRMADNRDRLFFAFATLTLACGLLFAGRVREAREPFEAAVPFMLRYDLNYRFAEIAALYAALCGDPATAARCLGHGVAGRTAHGEPDVAPHMVSARERTLARLDQVPASEVEAWMREGAAMTDAQVLHAAVAAGQAAAA